VDKTRKMSKQYFLGAILIVSFYSDEQQKKRVLESARIQARLM
jgi:hypothetical protein